MARMVVSSQYFFRTRIRMQRLPSDEKHEITSGGQKRRQRKSYTSIVDTVREYFTCFSPHETMHGTCPFALQDSSVLI